MCDGADHTSAADGSTTESIPASGPLALQSSPRTLGTVARGFIAWPMLKFIWFYKRFLSPLKPPSCRFYPTCSTYTYEAITLYGPFRGAWMGAKRIARCQPFCEGGFDPVPGSPLDVRAKTDPAFLESVRS